MSDAAIRVLERRAETEGDHEAEARRITALVRAGRLGWTGVAAAAHCGSKPARLAMGLPVDDATLALARAGNLSSQDEWGARFRKFGLDSFAWLVVETLRAMAGGTQRSGEERGKALHDADQKRLRRTADAIAAYLPTRRTAEDRKRLSGAIYSLNISTPEFPMTALGYGVWESMAEIPANYGLLDPCSPTPLLRDADRDTNCAAWAVVPERLADRFLGDPWRPWWETTASVTCRTCGDTGRELIDCEGSAGYRPCQACARRAR